MTLVITAVIGSLSLAPAFATAHEVTSNDSIGLQNGSSGLPRRVTPRNCTCQAISYIFAKNL